MRVFDSSGFRVVLCFFERFCVTVGDLHVVEFDSLQAYMEHMHVSLCDAVLFPSPRRRASLGSVRIVEGGTTL